MNRFFYAGGTIPESYWDSYVTREADDKLYYYLKLGEFCYVLTARQMGKSSLCNRTMERLSKDGFKCIYIDLTQIGKSTANQWYYSISDNILSQLDVELNLENWWKEHFNHTPLNKFVRLLERILLIEAQSNIVVFIDEIDYMLSLNKDEVDTDEFFASIRGLYNKRSNNSTFERINFALFGVTAPGHLIQDAERTPFNIGKSIHLTNFSYEISKEQLSKGFVNANDSQKEQIFKEIFKWTNGHPYLTQFLCKKITDYDYTKETASSLVVSLIHSFLSDANAEVKSHFSNIEDRIINNKLYNLKMLSCYQSLLNDEPIDNLFTDATQIYLRLSGLVIEKSGKLAINNQIYQEYFNQNWLEKSFNKINPYYSYLKRWLEGGKLDKNHAISPTLLLEYVDWAKEHQATAVDWEFIHFNEKVSNERKRRTNLLRTVLLLSFIILSTVALTYSIIRNFNNKLRNTLNDCLEAKDQIEKYNIENKLRSEYESLCSMLIYLNSDTSNDKNQEYSKKTIDSLRVKLSILQDSLSEISPSQGTGLLLNLIDLQEKNAKEITSLKNRLGTGYLQSDASDLGLIKKPSAQVFKDSAIIAIIPVCEENVDIDFINSNKLLISLISSLNKHLPNKFISGERIISSKAKSENLCQMPHKANDVGRNLKASIVVPIIYSLDNDRVICNINFYDIKRLTLYAPNKRISANKNDELKLKNQLYDKIIEVFQK